jgi:hypothetical protein
MCIPPLLDNGSVNTFPWQRRIIGGVFYAVRVVSKESRRLVLPVTFCLNLFLYLEYNSTISKSCFNVCIHRPMNNTTIQAGWRTYSQRDIHDNYTNTLGNYTITHSQRDIHDNYTNTLGNYTITHSQRDIHDNYTNITWELHNNTQSEGHTR